MSLLEDVVELSKRRGFFWPAFSIYGGEAGFYDYAPLGVLLRDNIVRIWKESYAREGAIFIDSPVIVPEPVFKASGHLQKFSDLAAECPSCRLRQKLENFLEANGFHETLKSTEEAQSFLAEHVVKCPNCGTRITSAYDFNLMYRVDGFSSRQLYLRPETAQGIFVNFRLLNNVFRGKLPMAVAQYGKGFRNEISPRQALIRLREFYQGEVEVFVDPDKKFWKEFNSNRQIRMLPRTGKEIETTVLAALDSGVITSNAMAYFIDKTYGILTSVGVDPARLRFRQQRADELAHYSFDSWDAEALLDDSWVEIVGIADRNDLRNHQDSSGQKFSIKVGGREIIPSVIEPSYGMDRITLTVLIHSLGVNSKGFKILRLRDDVAPYHMAILPLVNRDGIDEYAKKLFSAMISRDPYIYYDDSGSIGKRYARQDEIGTPYCITVDYDTLKDDTVTVRFRDTGKQAREDSRKIADRGLEVIRRIREELIPS
ncbi:MAG: glycine--tRNA ligase [Thermoplasmataceae archaeon]